MSTTETRMKCLNCGSLLYSYEEQYQLCDLCHDLGPEFVEELRRLQALEDEYQQNQKKKDSIIGNKDCVKWSNSNTIQKGVFV